MLKEMKGIFLNCLYFRNLSENQGLKCDRIWKHYNLAPDKTAIGYTASFGFKEESDLDFKIKEKCFKMFLKHFPDGKKSSLIGYPRLKYI